MSKNEKGLWHKRKLSVLGSRYTGLFFLVFVILVVSVVNTHPIFSTHAASVNTAEDNFTRPDSTLGWGTTTNNDSLTNYTWQRSLNNYTYAFIHSNAGIVTFTGYVQHKVAGYVSVPPYQGGDGLEEVSFSDLGSAISGPTLLVQGGSAWYEADLDTHRQILELVKRNLDKMNHLTSIPFPILTKTPYWIRVDVQVVNGVAQLNARAWQKGTAEPSSWQVTYADNSPLAAGNAGIMNDWWTTPLPKEDIKVYKWSYAATGLAVPPH